MPSIGAGTTLAKSSWEDGCVLPTNIVFNTDNLETISQYLNAPANKTYEYAQSTLKPTEYNVDDILKDKVNFSSVIDFGRLVDGQIPLSDVRPFTVPPAPYSKYLKSWIQSTAPATVISYGAYGIGATVPVSPPTYNSTKCYTHFTPETYAKAFLPPGNASLNYSIVDTTETAGVIVDYKQMCSSYGLGIVAVKYSGTDANGLADAVCVGFIMKPVNTPSMAQLDLRPLIYGDYCVFDPAFKREGNQMVKSVSNKLYGDYLVANGPAGGAKTGFSQIIQLGANNPTMAFDEGIGRFGLSNFYWAQYVGSGTSSTGVGDADNEIIKMNSLGGWASWRQTAVTGTPLMLQYAKSGLGILGYRMYNTESGLWETISTKYTNFVSNTPALTIDNVDEKASDWWSNCLLNRIGFDYQDIFPRVGNASALYQKNSYNILPTLSLQEPDPAIGDRSVLQFFNDGVKPLTLNPYFATSLSAGYSVNNYGQPMFDLEYQRGMGFNFSTVGPGPAPPMVKVASINVDATTDSQYASNLPKKLSYPYWLVYSDLIGGVEFIGDKGKKGNIMAVANRAYTSGDFAFNFATDYTYQAKKDFVVSQITTEILNPDYTKANIDDGTIILYKIQRNPGTSQETEKTKRVMPPQNKANNGRKK